MRLIERLWWTPRPGAGAAALLAPLALPEGLFRAALAVRTALHARGLAAVERAAVPVISVGNLAVGGAGKTPAVIALAARLMARGRRVAVLSRGYGATRADARVVSDGAAVRLGAAEGGDEPVLVARRLPGVAVLCGPRRADLARTAVATLGADALLLDDGFQHRALARDLDVVVLDAANPFGNGHLLPRGPNRESPSALRRANLAWLAKVDGAEPAALDRLRVLARDATGRAPVESRVAVTDVVDGSLDRSLGVAALAGARVLLLSALARPDAFRRTVASLGATIAAERTFPDHHRFSPDELDEVLRAAAAAGCDRVVTTEKDAVRLDAGHARDPRVCAVRIDAEVVSGGGELDALLDDLFAPASPPRSREAEPPDAPRNRSTR
jgi:tetraacyldisaccharide 4'-kinase